MINPILWAGIVLLSVESVCAAENLSDMRVVNGVCSPQSHIAEGQIGADLTKRQSRFFCNAMIIMTYGPSKDHTLVQFGQKEAHHGQIIGYGGMMLPDQNILAVERVYLTQGVPTRVTEGVCKFFYTVTRLSGVSCGAKIDEDSRRTVPVIAFDVTPGQ